ncbi:MAG TPA: molybdopterin-dependent oxidoreductase, partial [candidate division Zixibacteria bacterium]|nr:molybdopterin-dependent oxidoreductase [candidate division Zixibacteria bacterium]
MATPKLSAGGGTQALRYVLRKANAAGGVWSLYRRMHTKNACKTCALGMGGQKGGMVNEAGHFPEVCKKSVQAQVADMAGPIGESFFAQNSIDAFACLSPRELESLGRLAFPIMAGPGDTHFRRIGWDQALAVSAAALRDTTPDRAFFYSSGRAGNEAAFLLQLVARAYGTSNIHNCSYYCHSASGVALQQVVGSGTATVVLDDLAQTNCAIVAGANPASNHPRLITQLVKLRRRGGRVIVINPIRELGLTRFRVPSDWRSFLGGSE